MINKELKLKSQSTDDLPEIANQVISFLGSPRVTCLHGQMGAGKTTLVKSLLKALQAKDLGSSPTFSLINTYASPNFGEIYHLDLYRLNSTAEALDIGVEDVLYDDKWCFIEWPEHVKQLLPDGHAEIYISTEEDGRRIFHVKKTA